MDWEIIEFRVEHYNQVCNLFFHQSEKTIVRANIILYYGDSRALIDFDAEMPCYIEEENWYCAAEAIIAEMLYDIKVLE